MKIVTGLLMGLSLLAVACLTKAAIQYQQDLDSAQPGTYGNIGGHVFADYATLWTSVSHAGIYRQHYFVNEPLSFDMVSCDPGFPSNSLHKPHVSSDHLQSFVPLKTESGLGGHRKGDIHISETIFSSFTVSAGKKL